MIRIFSLLALLILLANSCVSYKDLEYKGFEGVSFDKELGCDPICISLSIYNPNTYAIVLRKTTANALVNKKELGRINLSNKVKLKPNQSTIVPLEISSEKDNVLSTVMNSLGVLFGKNIDVGVEGKLKIRVFGIGFRIEIDHHQDFNYRSLFK